MTEAYKLEIERRVASQRPRGAGSVAKRKILRDVKFGRVVIVPKTIPATKKKRIINIHG